MKLVVIESPFAGDLDRNVAYARAAMRDSLQRGEAPFASHLIYTQAGILDDNIPAERALGIAAGLQWADAAALVAVYIDFGISKGMAAAIEQHKISGVEIEYRTLSEFAASDAEVPA